MASKKPGLYANIHAKQKRIARGSKETMREPGEKGAPGQDDFKKAAKTEKPASMKKAAHEKSRAREEGKAQISQHKICEKQRVMPTGRRALPERSRADEAP